MSLNPRSLRWFRTITRTGFIIAIAATAYCIAIADWPQAIIMMVGAATFALVLRDSHQWEPTTSTHPNQT